MEPVQNDTLKLRAYHEAARVVFTYISGYTCDSMELISGEASSGQSKLNAGPDLALVKAILSVKPEAVPAGELLHAISVAKKLISIYCAGSCAELYFENDAQIPAELEMDIQGQDLKNIENIQRYLSMVVEGHPSDFPTQTIISTFKNLQDANTWKAIEMLVKKILDSDSKSLSTFYIEDSLMPCGIRRQKQSAKSGFSLDLQEQTAPQTHTKDLVDTSNQMLSESPLDLVLGDFLQNIRPDWDSAEIDAASKYIKNVFKKFGAS